MARYFDTLPEQLDCLACLAPFPIQSFRRERMRRAGGRMEWLVGEFCRPCAHAGPADELASNQQARYYQVIRLRETQREEMNRRQAKELAERFKDGRPNAKEAHSPFNVARRQLEAEWGPMEEWNRDQHYRHTVRMYEILGWDPANLDPSNEAARTAHKANLRERKGHAETVPPCHAAADPYADPWEPDA